MRCNYSTINKTMFKRHLLKKNTCPSKLNETSIYDILKLHGFDEEATKYENAHDCKSNVNLKCKSKCKSTVNLPNSNICPNCKKTFSCRQAKYKHLKYNCNILKLTEEPSNDSLNDKNELQKNYDALVIQVEEMVNKMALLETKTKSKTTNKILNNNTIINNINLNNYGSINPKDFNYLTKKVFAKLLETPLTAIPKLIGIKYFNEKHPENHNIKITNIHDKFAKIYKDKKWLISNKKDIIQELVENGYADFEEFRDLNEEELTDKIKERYKKMEKYYTQNFGELYKQSEMSIINGTNQLE